MPTSLARGSAAVPSESGPTADAPTAAASRSPTPSCRERPVLDRETPVLGRETPALDRETLALGREPIDSSVLLAGRSEVRIAHRGELYRLRQTALGKLILTK